MHETKSNETNRLKIAVLEHFQKIESATKEIKPKLILHVGPRKTGTTTIQGFLFDSNRGLSGSDVKKRRYLKQSMKKDKFYPILLTWSEG